MLFGSRARFAIECEILAQPAPSGPIWGNLWVWADGLRLGEGPGKVDIGFMANRLCESLRHRGRRKDVSLLGKSKEEVWTTIHAAIYGGMEPSPEEIGANSERFYKLIVLGNDEGFDNVSAVLVEEAEAARFIWRCKPWTLEAQAAIPKPYDESTYEVQLRSGEYETLVEGFLDWLEAETCWRPPHRDWISLSDDERDAFRRVVIARKPSLARKDRRSLLEDAARDEMVRTKKVAAGVRSCAD